MQRGHYEKTKELPKGSIDLDTAFILYNILTNLPTMQTLNQRQNKTLKKVHEG